MKNKLNTATGEYEALILRAPGNYDPDQVSRDTATECRDDTKTQQNTREETDINLIVERFTKTGTLPQVSLPARFGDFTDVPTFQEARDRINESDRAFMALPARVRAEFDNNPAAWLETVDKALEADDRSELRRMGLQVEDRPPPPEIPPVDTPPLGGK